MATHKSHVAETIEPWACAENGSSLPTNLTSQANRPRADTCPLMNVSVLKLKWTCNMKSIDGQGIRQRGSLKTEACVFGAVKARIESWNQRVAARFRMASSGNASRINKISASAPRKDSGSLKLGLHPMPTFLGPDWNVAGTTWLPTFLP